MALAKALSERRRLEDVDVVGEAEQPALELFGRRHVEVQHDTAIGLILDDLRGCQRRSRISSATMGENRIRTCWTWLRQHRRNARCCIEAFSSGRGATCSSVSSTDTLL